ncbi:ATP11-domain-containing protein [Xylona heveae TC161]|uniref:ATP11-domain-containing protein n=1 Tax=Xylona heveae (strain CBS 132557 / TC161) TaxID=1328760 RepID=A0A165JZM6_XYLHT|nr:ATP11-domain-containing protein [Xylona heveae TC161]KZF26825.1 ATP11-domain-containing protein [Xylona heveae TC161]
MSAFRAPSLRSALRSATLPLRGTQRRWAQVHDVRFLATHRDPNRYVDKYREKLTEKAKEQGLNNVDELKEVYKEKIDAFRKEAAVPGANSPFPPPPPPPTPQTEPTPSPTFNGSTPPASASSPNSKVPPGVKTLSSFIDVEKTQSLPPKEIEYIWRLRHANDKNSLCAVVPASTYARIAETARKYPQFILPLPREEQGAEIHFLQWTFPTLDQATVLFTSLAEFKLRGEFAQPHTTITHHLDLADSKGLVLLQGAVVESSGVSVDDSRFLLMCLQKFYAIEDQQTPGRQKLLEQFSQGDAGFKVEELLEEAEKL